MNVLWSQRSSHAGHGLPVELFSDQDIVSVGRNGVIKTSGLVIHEQDDGVVDVRPLNSRGKAGNCSTRFPVDAWHGAALRSLLDHLEGLDMLPTLVGLHPLLDRMVSERLRKED